MTAQAHPRDRGRARSLPDLGALRPGQHLRALEVEPDLDGPRVRLGMLWAFVTFALLSVGSVLVALWMALVAGAAAAQAARSWRRAELRPSIPVAAATALLLPLAALAGWSGVIVVALISAIAAVVLYRLEQIARPGLTVLIGTSIGVAGSALVLARSLGFVEGVVLLSIVGVYDASAFLVGTGATNPWEGPAAGIAAIGAFSLAVAAVFAAPFGGASPWVLGAIAAALAPLGPYAATALLGDRRRRVPALRRLDSLLLLGPVWVLVATALVD